jgi:hydroxymethylpyrimidine/phosphomethylpyrimidine kinase
MKLWVIGGLDPTGGAGVLRDRWTAELLVPGIEVITAITSRTEQGDGKPARSHPIAADELALQGLVDADAIKLGLVPASCTDAVIDALSSVRAPSVLDPVLHASDGGALGATPESLRRLASVVSLVTPNRAEALALGELPTATLLKDVEPGGARVCDRLRFDGGVHDFVRPRASSIDPRGTGCALATAIACGLGRGEALVEACAGAIAWLDRARLQCTTGPDGRPHLPR